MKTFFVVPGFRMQASHKMFSWLIKYLRSQKYKVIKVPVKWERSTLTQNAVAFKDFFNEHKGKTNYILGFSYGAVITLLTANELRPKKIFLCSLSAAFIEDSKNMKKRSIKYIGKNRFNDMQTRSGRKIARSLSVPSVVFYGEKEGREYPKLKIRCEETVKLARNSKLIIVKNAPHQIDYPTYIEAIKKVIQ